MSEPPPPPLSDDEARRQRQEALRALSHSPSGSPPALTWRASGEPTRQPRRDWRQAPAVTARRRPRWLVVLGGVVALLLVAGVVLHQLGIFPGRAATRHRGPVVLDLSLKDLDCVQDAAWSPNGQQVAALGYREECPNDVPSLYNYQAGVLHIYAAATGKLVQTILPDATVLALPGVPAPPANARPATALADTSKPVMNYTNMLWSPDGKQLALNFWIGRWNAAETVEAIAYQGLVLVNADGTNERAALLNETSRQYSALRWDTTTLGSLGLAPAQRYGMDAVGAWGIGVLGPTPQQRYGDFVSLPPALRYSWGADGQLIPQGSLTSASSSRIDYYADPTAAVGNPDGGSSFTIWQPGSIVLNPVFNPALGYYPIPTWDTSFLAWSPDGHYLIDAFQLEGIVHPVDQPSPTAAELQAEGYEGAPNVASRDPALQGLLNSLRDDNMTPGIPTTNMAWSPNGRVLAAISDDKTTKGNGFSLPVTLYDCATGNTIRTLQPQLSSEPGSEPAGLVNPNLGFAALLRWSADGSQLLEYSEQLGTITIWGPSMLPKSAAA